MEMFSAWDNNTFGGFRTWHLVAAVVVAGGSLAVIDSASNASGSAPVSDCDAAISALNKQLPVIAKNKIGVRIAQSTSSRAKVITAKKRYASSRRVANEIRVKIKQHCSGGGVQSMSAFCSQSIDVYSSSLNLLATKKFQYARIKGKKSRAAKKRKRALRTQIKHIGSNINNQSHTFHDACSNPPKPPVTPPTSTNNPYDDPVTTVACTPAQFTGKFGCFAGVPATAIPSYPDGLKTNYQVSISGHIEGVCSNSGLAPAYKLLLIVDHTIVATDDDGGFVQTACNPTIDMQAAVSGLTLSPTTSHRIALGLQTSILLPVTPKVDSGSMTVDVAQL